MTSLEPPAPTPSGVDHCLSCGQPLAHDQRYCVHCGTRRSSLPAAIAASLREMSGDRASPGEGADSTPAEPLQPAGARAVDIFPLARAAAVSILLMLGLGAVFGASLRPGGIASLAREVVLVVHHPAPAPVAVASTPTPSPSTVSGGSGGGSGGGSSSGAGAPASSAGGSGGGSGTGASSGSGSGTGSGSGSGSGSGTGPEPATKLPPIGHVWEIVLSGQGYAQSFGTSIGHKYLSKTLVGQGELITQYDAVASSPLANEVALISGQGPTEQTIANCPTYSDVTPGTTGKLGQVLGTGCLYPSSTETLGQQLQINGLTWRAYIQGIGSSGQRHPPQTTTTTGSTTATTPVTTTTTGSTTATTPVTTTTTSSSTTAPPADTSTAAGCPHPAQDATDGAQAVTGKDGYVTWKNPWVYFHSAVDDHAACAKRDVGLTRLAKDLRSDSTTPAFSYIAPDPCDDGSDTPCRPGAKGGLARADAFLHEVVPEIERSAAYKTDGLILITFDEAPQSGPDWSTASCCGQPTFPNLAPSTTSTTSTTAPTTPTTPTTTTSSTTTPTTTAPTTTSGTTSTTTTSANCPTTASTTATSPTTPTTPTTTTPTDCAPAITGDPPGGGQVGLLMISPYIKPNTLNTIETYNHFSLLKSIETLFGVPHLGYTADKQVPAFIPSLFLSQKR